ncbi:MAG: outer membrane beta-barrel protein [Pseudomonadota bacterium]
MKRNAILLSIWGAAIAVLALLTLTPNVMTIEGQSDKMLHITGFCLLMLPGVLVLSNWRRIIIAALALTLIGLAIEILQELSPGRNSSLEDALANIAGVIAGLIIGALMRADFKKVAKALVIACLPFTLSAQASDDVVMVSQNPTPPFEALGMRLGTLMIYPEVTLEERWDDNIFKTPNNEESDLITKLSPQIRVKTDWSLHELSAVARGDLGFFADNDNENFTDYNLGIGGRLDIGHDMFLYGNIDYAQDHDSRDDPNDVNGDEPTEYQTLRARAGLTREVARLKLYLSGEYADITFDNAFRGNTVIDNGGRDREEYRGEAKLAYEFSPRYEAFARARLIDINYDELTSGQDRSSSGYEAALGTAINISGKTKGEIYAGTIQRDFGAGLSDVNELNYGGSVIWNISGLTSLKGEIDRSLFEAIGSGVSGYLRTRGDLTLEHAFRQNIIARAGLGYRDDEFIGSTREDETWSAYLGGDYKLNRAIAVGLEAKHISRDSNNAAANYDNNIITARVKLKR